MILLDSNVPLYAFGTAHELRDPCRRIVTAVATGRVTGFLADIVISEVLHVRAKRSPRGEVAVLMSNLLAGTTGVLTSNDEVRRQALELFATHPRIGANDALIAALAIHHGVALVSADRGFADVANLVWAPPADVAGALDPPDAS